MAATNPAGLAAVQNRPALAGCQSKVGSAVPEPGRLRGRSVRGDRGLHPDSQLGKSCSGTKPRDWADPAETGNANYEGWFYGGPEFEVMLTYRSPGAASMIERQCAGEYAATTFNQPGVMGSSFVFNWENLSWTGLVQIATLTQFQQAQAADNGAMLFLIEDDEDSCRIRQNATNLNAIIQAVRILAAMTGKVGTKPKDWGWVVEGAALVVNVLSIGTFFNPDDIVGLFIDKPDVIPCTVPAGYTHAVVKDNNCKGYVSVVQKLN